MTLLNEAKVSRSQGVKGSTGRGRHRYDKRGFVVGTKAGRLGRPSSRMSGWPPDAALVTFRRLWPAPASARHQSIGGPRRAGSDSLGHTARTSETHWPTEETPMIQAASGSVTGLPAVLIILVVLALIVIGIVSVVRFIGRRAKR